MSQSRDASNSAFTGYLVLGRETPLETINAITHTKVFLFGNITAQQIEALPPCVVKVILPFMGEKLEDDAMIKLVKALPHTVAIISKIPSVAVAQALPAHIHQVEIGPTTTAEAVKEIPLTVNDLCVENYISAEVKQAVEEWRARKLSATLQISGRVPQAVEVPQVILPQQQAQTPSQEAPASAKRPREEDDSLSLPDKRPRIEASTAQVLSTISTEAPSVVTPGVVGQAANSSLELEEDPLIAFALVAEAHGDSDRVAYLEGDIENLRSETGRRHR